MTTTRSQIRKMDDVALLHVLRVNERLLASAKASGNKDAEKTLTTTLREMNVELARREALEAA